jgi:serine/threonine protein kinase
MYENKDLRSKEIFMNEVRIMKQLKHPKIPTLLFYNDYTFVIVMTKKKAKV